MNEQTIGIILTVSYCLIAIFLVVNFENLYWDIHDWLYKKYSKEYKLIQKATNLNKTTKWTIDLGPKDGQKIYLDQKIKVHFPPEFYKDNPQIECLTFNGDEKDKLKALRDAISYVEQQISVK